MNNDGRIDLPLAGVQMGVSKEFGLGASMEAYMKAADILKENSPELWNLVSPRRYLPRQGYCNPKFLGTMIAHQLRSNANMKLGKTIIDYLLIDWKLCELKVPTFFIAYDFLKDLMLTTPPGDMTLGELNWPDAAMCFLLPEQFQMEYFGFKVPTVNVAHIPTGKTNPPDCVSSVMRQKAGVGIGYEGEHGVIVNATVFNGHNGGGQDYSGSYSDEDLLATAITDLTFQESSRLEVSNGFIMTVLDEEIQATPQDTDIAQKIMTVGLQIVMAMGQLPQYVAREEVERPEKKYSDGTIKHEGLWKPRMFGGAYVREKPPVGNGTHASPRFHRRKGHWRREIGYREKLAAGLKPSTQWIKPFWVGVKV